MFHSGVGFFVFLLDGVILVIASVCLRSCRLSLSLSLLKRALVNYLAS